MVAQRLGQSPDAAAEVEGSLPRKGNAEGLGLAQETGNGPLHVLEKLPRVPFAVLLVRVGQDGPQWILNAKVVPVSLQLLQLRVASVLYRQFIDHAALLPA